jgi:hypothetical protein
MEPLPRCLVRHRSRTDSSLIRTASKLPAPRECQVSKLKGISSLLFTLMALWVPHQEFMSTDPIGISSRSLHCLYHETDYSQVSEPCSFFLTTQGALQYANRGDIATGRIIREEKDELDLDTSPCSGSKVVRFHAPYDKAIIGQSKCGDKAFAQTQVEQR